MVDPLVQPWTPAQVAVMEGLRDWSVAFAEMNRHLAQWMTLPASDCLALAQIIWAEQGGEPLTPVRLARNVGMTSGATTALLHRLEAAGMVTRSREHADRRRVTLRPTPNAVDQVRRFLAQAGPETAAVLLHSSPDDLTAVSAMLARLTAAMRAANDRLDRQG